MPTVFRKLDSSKVTFRNKELIKLISNKERESVLLVKGGWTGLEPRSSEEHRGEKESKPSQDYRRSHAPPSCGTAAR